MCEERRRRLERLVGKRYNTKKFLRAKVLYDIIARVFD